MAQIYCKNSNQTKEVKENSTLLDIYNLFELNMPYGPVSARVNNSVEDLNYRIYSNKDIEFIDITDPSGMRTYARSLCCLLVKAVEDLFPKGRVILEHTISKGYFFQLHIGRTITIEDVHLVKERMQELIEMKLPYRRIEDRTEKVIALFAEKGMKDTVRLLETSGQIYSSYYKLGDTIDYYYGSLVPHTGYLHLFDIVKYYDGVLLRVPMSGNPEKLEDIVKQEKMLEVFDEYLSWQSIWKISTVGDFNVACRAGKAIDLINVAEALQEKKIARIADEIAERGKKGTPIRLILISGPSSSGKTTFSKRLSVQLMTCGLKPYSISLDDFFVDREQTPLDENGDYDFESLHALDLDYFGECMKRLIDGEKIELPRFDFTTGKRMPSGEKLRLRDDMVLILEGIHALNPSLIPIIPAEQKFKVYVSALTSIRLDHHNYIPTTDNRLLRRIVRDYKYRNYSARDTIGRWKSVRAGEDKWIFPYQEQADAMFNSALLFELAIIKDHALPILSNVPQDCPEYSEAQRLLRFLEYFTSISDKEIPPTSLLREFLGGSSFRY